MYGLPQAGIIVSQLLDRHLATHGYHQTKSTPGIWRHFTRHIQFTLVVDDFGVQYVGKSMPDISLMLWKRTAQFQKIGIAASIVALL
jgi:hypothetical protein